jgi:cullin-associated NEDD8-dissociated protein 1
LHLLGPALLVLASLVLDEPKIVVTDQLNVALCGLLTAPLGGAVLEAVLTLVTNIGEKAAGQQLMAGLLKDVSINGEPTVVGKVIGTLLVYGGSSVGVTIDNFMDELHNPQSEDAKRSLALAVLGEAGLRWGVQSPLKPSTFIAQFRSRSDKVRLAAAIALGRAGAGNIPVYLPEILATMDSGGNTQYLLLHSIKEYCSKSETALLTSAIIPNQFGNDSSLLHKPKTTRPWEPNVLEGLQSSTQRRLCHSCR